MIFTNMRILLPARHGLGDVLAGYFIAERGRLVLARVRAGLESGQIGSAMVVYEHHYNPSTGDLFRALPFDLKVLRTTELAEVVDTDSDNRMPTAVRWHQNVFTNPPAGFGDLDASTEVACPARPPSWEVPNEFLLFSDGASAPDRCLTDHTIYSFLRDVTGLPIVKVGRGHDVVPADINLCGRLNIVETLFLAKRARVVVSGLTMLRTCSALFGTPVIELAEHPTSDTLRRTRWEYDAGFYGMTPRLNQWFLWPSQTAEARRALSRFGASQGG
jgi:hypothetical protein